MKSFKLFYLLLLTFVISGNYNAQCSASSTYSVDSSNCNTILFSAANTGNTFLWTFGDGTSSSAQNPSRTYLNNGTYSVILTVSQIDSSGNISCSDTSMLSIVINCGTSTPTCDASYTYTVDSTNCNTVSFQGPAGYTIYQWNFADGSTSSSQNPTHTFAGNGTFNVGLSVMLLDSSGTIICDDSTYMNITINCGTSTPNCTASYTYTIDSMNCNTVYFQAPAGYSTYQWDFADGSTSTSQNPTHTFAGNGTFNVGLSVMLTDSSGNTICDDSTYMNVTINCVTSIEEQSTLSINAYPNPFVGELNVTIEANEYQEVEISITSISGAILNSQVYQLNNGTNKIQLNNSDLSSGIYLLNIRNLETNENSVQRIVKQ